MRMVDTTDEATINIILLKYVPNNGTAWKKIYRKKKNLKLIKTVCWFAFDAFAWISMVANDAIERGSFREQTLIAWIYM